MKAKIFILLIVGATLYSCTDATRDELIIKQINDLYGQRQYEAAKISVDSFVNLNPGNEKAWTLKGNIEESLDNDSAAYGAYQKALDINPKMEQALTGMGILSRKRGDFDHAAGYYYKAIKANPEYAPAYSSLVTIELKRKNFENAVKLGEKGYLLDKEDPVIAANLAIAYHYYGDTINRNHYYEIAKKLNYRNIDALPLIFSGEVNIFN